MPVIPPAFTVPFEELEGSPTETISEEGRLVTRKLKCLWDDRYTLFRELLGTTAVVDGDTGEQIIRTPDTYEEDPFMVTPMFARGVAIAPFDAKIEDADGDGRTAKYGHAQLTVTYRTGRYQDETAGGGGTVEQPDIIIEESLEPEAENISVEASNLVWESASKEANPGTKRVRIDPIGVPSKLEISLGWVVTFFNVADPINPAFFDHLGKINNTQITSQKFGRTFFADTLLYSSFNAHRTFTTEGAQSWTITCRFSNRVRLTARKSAIDGLLMGALGWNGIWRQEIEDYDAIAVTDGVTSIAEERRNLYQGADFTELFLRQ